MERRSRPVQEPERSHLEAQHDQPADDDLLDLVTPSAGSQEKKWTWNVCNGASPPRSAW